MIVMERTEICKEYNGDCDDCPASQTRKPYCDLGYLTKYKDSDSE